MATNNSDKESEVKKQAPLIAIIAAGIVLLGFLAWLGYDNFGPPKPAPTDAQGRKNTDFILSLVEKSGGDYSKVSVEDKAKLEKMTFNHGGMAFYSLKKQHDGK